MASCPQGRPSAEGESPVRLRLSAGHEPHALYTTLRSVAERLERKGGSQANSTIDFIIPIRLSVSLSPSVPSDCRLQIDPQADSAVNLFIAAMAQGSYAGSTPRSIGSPYSDEERSSESWGEDASSSDDGRVALPSAPVRIKLKRHRPPRPEPTPNDHDSASSAGTGAVSATGRNSPHSSSTGRNSMLPADSKIRARPLKQLRMKPLRAALDSLILNLKKRDSYLFFHEPVNADEVPGYREVITHPMDLGTMEKRIHEGYYTNMDMFQHDFMLVTQNAQRFNPPSSIYHSAARRLEGWGLRAIARESQSVVNEDQLPAPTSPGSSMQEDTPQRRGRRKRTAHERAMGEGHSIEAEPHAAQLSRRMMRVGSARSTTWSLQGVETSDPAELLFRRTLAYAGVGQHQLTGKSACCAREHAKPKRRLGTPLSDLLDVPTASSSSNTTSGPTTVPASTSTKTSNGSTQVASATTAPVTDRHPDENDGSTFVFHDDGALDASEISDVREFLAQRMLLAPELESLQHLPMMLAAVPSSSSGNAPTELSLVFPPAQLGRPDALHAATRRNPEAPSVNMSHTFDGTQVPDMQRAMPYAIASTPGPPGLGSHGTRPIRPVWPARPPPAIQESGLRLNRRERELEQERDEHNWTFFRPHMRRILALEDVGLYASMPAWAACVADDQPLQPYASVTNERLMQALREHLRSMPYRAMSLPRTAQYVPRSSLHQLPPALQLSMQGAQETERLIETVYGSVDGLAYARSLAEFVTGAAEMDSCCEKEEQEEEEKEKEEEKQDLFTAKNPASLPARKRQRQRWNVELLQHVQSHVVEPLTGGLLRILQDTAHTLEQCSERSSNLMDLLDDSDGSLAAALWDAQAGAAKEHENVPALDKVLETILNKPSGTGVMTSATSSTTAS